MKNNILKIFSIILAIALAVSVGSVAAAAEQGNEGGALIVKSDALELSIDKATGALTLKELSGGAVWTSTPNGAADDPLASGITRTNLLSRIVVCYKNGNSLAYTNDYIGAVLKNTVKYEVKGSSITAGYSFPDQDFFIPIEYSVEGNTFSAKILADKITDGSKFLINTIDLLPFFGAGSKTDNGFMLVPDGSGAVIEYNNGKQDFDEYKKRVFGEDLSMESEIKELNYQKILIASFGVKKNSSAFIANISVGAPSATINASVSGQFSSFNRIYASFCYRNIQYIKATDNTGNNPSGLFSAINSTDAKEFCVEYTILEGENPGLSDMADASRKRLEKAGVGSELKSRLVLDFYGGTQREKAFLGLRYTGTQQLTSYGDVLDIIASLNKDGVPNIDASLRFFTFDAIAGRLSSGFKFTSKLGKKADYKKLIKQEDVYPYINLNSFSKGSLSYNRFFTSVFGLDLVPVERYSYSIQGRRYDDKKSASYLVPYTKMEKAVGRLESSIKSGELSGISVDSLSGSLYSDFAKKGKLRDSAMQSACEILNKVKAKKTGVMAAAPNEYAFKYADVITDLPLSSSGYGLFDYDVPFVQMSLHGLIDYTCESVNLGAISRRQLLQIIKSGSGLKFSVIKNGGKSITDTELEYLSSADFDDISDIIVEWYKEVAAVNSEIGEAAMVSFTQSGSVSVTEYSNGVKVYVNSGKTDSEINGVSLPAMDYKIEKK